MKTIWGQIVVLIGILLSFVVGYFIVTSIGNFGKIETIFISFICLSILYGAYKPVKTLISKEQFSFDLTLQTFYHNQILKSSISEIEFVEIINCSGGSEGADTYLLNMRLKDKSSIQIDDNPNKKEVYRVAGEIASFINKEVKNK